jgi:1-phosphofructokinase
MADHVMVFAPAPQLTVTLDQPNGATEIHLHPGGQGVWQARMITCLGTRVVLCASLGGEIGQVLEPLMADEGVDLKVVRRDSSSGGYLHDQRSGSLREIADVPGEPLTRHEMDELYNLALGEGLRAPVSVLSGPGSPSLVSADTYRRLAADLGENGSMVIADLSGAHLAATLESGLFFLKVSHEELIRDGRVANDSEDELTRALYQLQAEGARSVVVSRAAEPALALIDGLAARIEMPRLHAIDPRGAGDSMTAGVAAVLASGGDLATAIRTGAAAGALNVTRHGLGTGRADSIAGLVDRVRLVPVEDGRQERVSPQQFAGRTTRS